MRSEFILWGQIRRLVPPLRLLALLALLAQAPGGAFGASPVRATVQGPELAALAATADSVSIDFWEPGQKSARAVRFQDPAWVARLAVLLGAGAYLPREHCLCVSWPEIKLVREGRVILRLSVHHGETLRLSGEAGSGDFQVGAELGAAVEALANQRRDDAPR